MVGGSGHTYTLSPSAETVGRMYLDMPKAERDVLFEEFTGVAQKLEADMKKEKDRQQTLSDVKRKADAAKEAARAAKVADFTAKLLLEEIEGESSAGAAPGIAERLANLAGFVSPTRRR